MNDLFIFNQKLRAMRIWKSATQKMSLQMGRIHNRLKGRLLLSLAEHLQPSMTLQQAMLRWKICADRTIGQAAIAKFATGAKLNPLTALWRLKGALVTGEKKKRREEYLEKVQRALVILSGIVNKLVRVNLHSAYVNIEEIVNRRRLAMKMLFKLEERFKQTKMIAFLRWKDQKVVKDSDVFQKVVIRCIYQTNVVLSRYLHHWRCFAAVRKISQEEGLNVAVEKVEAFIKYKLEKTNNFSLNALLGENRTQEALEYQYQFESVKFDNASKIMKATLDKSKRNRQNTAFESLRLYGLEKQAARENAIRQLATIFAGRGLRDSIRIWKLAVSLQKAAETHQIVARVFENLNTSLQANTVEIFELETNLKRKLALRYEKSKWFLEIN